MNMKASGPAKTAGTSKLIPDEFAQLIGEPPLINGEKLDDYNLLLASIVADLEPATIIEWLTVKDIVDAHWDARRLRGVKVRLIDKNMLYAFKAVVSKAIEISKDMTHYDATEEAERMLVRSYKSMAGYEAVSKMLSAVGLDPKAIPATAVADCFDIIERLDASIFHHEKLRDQYLRDFGQRRAERSARQKLTDRANFEVADAAE